uniref:DCD domain-containing protein n=1 Tax=Leersia perrieri TaxID=77586 RepID=A0A0D9WKJ6_9ORYZ
MEGGSYDREFWQFSDQLRVHNFSSLSIADSIWSPAPAAAPLDNSNKLAFSNATTNAADRYNNIINNKSSSSYLFPSQQLLNNATAKTYFDKSVGRPAKNNNNNTVFVNDGKKKGIDGGRNNNSNKNNNKNENKSISNRFKSLPASESLPKEEAIGGYIFVCNNETMEENLKRQLFGLPSRYRDSVRAIRPGLPLFLYNYSTHQLHGIFEAASFGGSNIDPAAWEDSKCPGESRFPAQVRVATRKICDPLEEDAFRPVLHHYDGPKFRLELSVAEAVSLLDIFAEKLFA